VVIIGRGGGSAEDLWAFNYEAGARAIAACRVPIVSGVGHEVDVTIADLVADVRAATPSNAAELVVPERAALIERIAAAERRLVRAMEVEVGRERLRIQRLLRSLEDPRHKHARVRRAYAEHAARVETAMRRTLAEERRGLDALRHRLLGHSRAPTAEARAELDSLERRLRTVAKARAERARARLEAAMGKLDALSPLRVLDRGYAIAFKEPEGNAIRSVAEVRPGDAISVRLKDGSLRARVEGERE
jgi:exodeoxyribonuclease VII large subunit